MNSLISGRTLGALLPLMAAIACSSESGSGVTGTASITGTSVGPIKAAALIPSGAVTDGGIAAGGAITYIQFFGSEAGAACSALDGSTLSLVGSLEVMQDPSTLAGTTVTFGGTSGPVLLLPATEPADAGGVDASDDDFDAGVSTATPSLVAVSGTVSFTGSGSDLSGKMDVKMVLASSPGSDPVNVTGTFSAPLCSD